MISMLIIMSIFNFDQYLEIGRVLLFEILPAIIVILTIYTIWGIVNDMKAEEDEAELERLSDLEEV